MANQIIVTSNNTVQVAIEPTPNVEVTISRTAVGTIANVPTANYANFAGNVVNAAQPNITSVGNLTSLNVTGTTTTGNLVVLGNLQVGNLVANTANYANFAGNAFAVAGANVTGTVANATFATTAGSANTANIANSAIVANSANAVAGANVSGTVANATFATTAGSANTANSATVANSANSVAGANVSGTVANAAYADNAGNANFANSATVASSANSVTLANVSGAGNIASINIDGSGSNVLYGNGIFAPAAGGNTANANYANFAGNAFSVDGGNVVGAVANANFAANAGFAANANVAVVANSANSVALANVSGAGNIASINIDGSSSNVLYGNGIFAPVATGNVANANYANFAGNAFSVDGSNVVGAVANATYAANAGNANIANSANTAGTVTTNAQPNITSVGTLTNLSVTGNISANVINANYVNANINLTNVDSVFFDTNAAVTLTTPGQLAWDDGDGTLQLLMKGGNVTQQIGTQEYARVFNAEATTLNKGEVVYIFGAQGNRLSVKRAQANSEATSFGTIGFVAESIANGQEGFIITSGALYKLNTNGLTAGNSVYLSPSVAGGYTTTKPSAPDQLVVLGWIERVSTTVGSIYVKVDNGYELNELHDVLIANAVAGQALVYNSSNLWVNGNPEQANIANIAYSVAAANVSGLGNIATINLDGNASNLLNGAGSFVAIPTSTANANYANFAGTVLTNAQPNITSVGNLSALTVTGTLTGNAITWSNLITYNGNIAVNDKILVQADLPGVAQVRNLGIRAGNISNVSASNTAAGGIFVNGGQSVSADAGNAFIARAGAMSMSGGLANTANGAAFSGACQLTPGAAISNNANATAGVLFLTTGAAIANNGNAIMGNSFIGAGSATATNGNALGQNFSFIGANARSNISGNAFGGNLLIIGGNAVSNVGNAISGNISITTGAATANLTSGTATVGSININTGIANGITANVLGNINIGTNGLSNAINVGAIGTPVNVAGNLNVTGNITANNLGNIATINLDGSASNVLYGNGTFATPPSGGGETLSPFLLMGG